MPEKSTVEKAKEDLREGKSPSTAAGEFVREEIEHIREGKLADFASRYVNSCLEPPPTNAAVSRSDGTKLHRLPGRRNLFPRGALALSLSPPANFRQRASLRNELPRRG
jgi:hypothetical protein